MEFKKGGKLLEGDFFNFLFYQKPGGETKFAFVISKRIDKRASKRNRAKRVLAEVVRKILSKIKPGTHGLFFLKKKILEKDFSEVKTEVERVFKEANLLNEKDNA
jgi:ribonuclease P protein component